MNKLSFKEEVKVIQYAKYEGSRRLSFQSDSSMVMLVIFSMCVLTASIIFLVYPDLEKENQTLISLVLSILTINSIVFQLFAFGRKYDAKSRELFLCADELSELVRQLDVECPDENTAVSNGIVDRYNKILAKFSEQHKTVDYFLAKHWVQNTPINENKKYYFERNFVKYRFFVFFVLSSLILSFSIVAIVNGFNLRVV